MDKLFGGNDGEGDLRRIAEIREQLGMGGSGVLKSDLLQKEESSEHVENPV
jgi:hypothetical protein